MMTIGTLACSARGLLGALAAAILIHAPGFTQSGYQGTITAVQANIRGAPSLQAPILTSLPQGTRLAVLGKESNWYRVLLPDQQGDRSAFVHESTIRVEAVVTTPMTSAALSARASAPGPSAALADAIPAGARDPARAQLMSYLVPGGGHLYSGEYDRGAAHLIGGVAGYLLGDALSNHYTAQRRELENAELGALVDCIGDVISTFFCNYPSVPRYLGIAVLGVSWLAGIADAPESAHRMNEKAGLHIRISTATVSPLVNINGDGRPKVGFTLSRN
jgi:hypothetical protein